MLVGVARNVDCSAASWCRWCMFPAKLVQAKANTDERTLGRFRKERLPCHAKFSSGRSAAHVQRSYWQMMDHGETVATDSASTVINSQLTLEDPE
jgi:hypothetical protein